MGSDGVKWIGVGRDATGGAGVCSRRTYAVGCLRPPVPRDMFGDGLLRGRFRVSDKRPLPRSGHGRAGHSCIRAASAYL